MTNLPVLCADCLENW